jgi:hypothetical protein
VWNAQRRARDQELRALLIKSQAAPEPERSMLITRVIALLT